LKKLFQVKRLGKDKDDLFWSFGKIHGLENIAFADPNELASTNGNPVAIQNLVNNVDKDKFDLHSYEHLEMELNKSLSEFKSKVDSMDLLASDRKKLVSLPFFLSKRR
jgi:hypothetical protein